MTLQYDSSLPAEPRDGAPLIVLLHGRGSNKADLMGLRPRLPADAIVVTPQAPFAGEAWGYGGGWAWYRFLGGTTPEPATFAHGQQELATALEAIKADLPVTPGPTIIGGFSQGATSSLAFAVRNPGAVDGVLMFSGFLADNPSVDPAAADGLEVFWGHGRFDEMIPYADAEAGRAALRAANARLTTYDFNGGHWIDPGEFERALMWIEALRAAWSGERR